MSSPQAQLFSQVTPLQSVPYSVEAEQSVLGGLMIDNSAWEKVAEIVTVTDFYRQDHQKIFNAITNLESKNSPFDIVTVSEWFENNGTDRQLAYLGSLANNTPSTANIVAYAKIVRERAIFRQIIHAGHQIVQMGVNPDGLNCDEVLDNAEKLIMEIAASREKQRGSFLPIKSLLVKAVDRIDHLFQQDSPYTGLQTGYKDFDDLTSGLQPGDFIIIAGRPSMGKTSYALSIAENVVLTSKMGAALFSMEMPGEQLAMRLLSTIGRIPLQKVRSAQLDDEDWPRLTHAVSQLAEAPLFIDDTPALSPLELRSRLRRLKREHDIQLALIDYLQLMQVPGMKDNRNGEISEISRSMKALAKELNIPIVALSQLNRNLEQRPNKRPIMSDLRESGSLEQDADVIAFIYRDEVYNEDSPDKGIAEIIIGKQRNGPIDTVRLTFLSQYTRFENMARYDDY